MKIPQAVTEEQQSTSGIQSGYPGARRKEILAEENIFMSVPIEICHDDTESGRELRLGRKRFRVEVIAPVQENRRSESRGSDTF